MNRDHIFRLLLLLMFMISASFGRLQAQFTLQAELRPRVEYRHGYKSLPPTDAQPGFQISQRTRLEAGYDIKGLKMGLSLQDVRLWGETPQLTSVSNRFMLHEAWAELALSEHSSLKMGRQELVYDDARLFGNGDWGQAARSHDLLLFKYERGFSLHIGAAYNQSSDLLFGSTYKMTNNYKTLQFGRLNGKIGVVNASFLFINNGMEYKYTENNTDKYKTVFSQTFGTHLKHEASRGKIYANAFYSVGKDASDRELSAYNLMLGGDLKLNKNFDTGIGYELLSGTSQREALNNPTYTNHSFSPLNGTTHKFNGFMDYFYSGNHLNSVGLHDIFASVTTRSKKSSLQLAMHIFAAANEVLKANSINETMDSYLGTEFDLTFTHKVNDITNLTAGYSQMFGSETLAKLNGGDTKELSNWFYVMISFKPIFLK